MRHHNDAHDDVSVLVRQEKVQDTNSQVQRSSHGSRIDESTMTADSLVVSTVDVYSDGSVVVVDKPMKKAMPGIDMWNRDVNSMSAMRREKPETVVDNSNASGQEHNAGVEQTAYVNLSLFNDIVLGIGEIGTEPSVDVGITSIDEVTTEAGSQFDGPEWGLYPQRL